MMSQFSSSPSEPLTHDGKGTDKNIASTTVAQQGGLRSKPSVLSPFQCLARRRYMFHLTLDIKEIQVVQSPADRPPRQRRPNLLTLAL